MRRLTYFVASSIDGFIASADGSLAAFFPLPDGLLEHLVAEFPETLPTHLHDSLGVREPAGRFDTVVMGRGTYEPGVQEGVTSPYAHLRQFVVSSTLQSPDPAVTVLAGDPVAAVGELKREAGGGIWLAGGGRTAAALLPEIDEIIVKIYPFVLGSGIPMFDGAIDPTGFVLTETRALPSGAAIHTYARHL